MAVPVADRGRDLLPPTQNEDEVFVLPTMGGADAFLRFLSDELMPWMDGRYRTRPYAVLVGHSAGGLFAIHALTTRPDLFDAYIAISPALRRDDQRMVAQAETFFENTSELNADLYMTMANEGGAALEVCEWRAYSTNMPRRDFAGAFD